MLETLFTTNLMFLSPLLSLLKIPKKCYRILYISLSSFWRHIQIISGGNPLQLPESLQNLNVIEIISLARSKRAEQFLRKNDAEHQVHHCEKQLEALRWELSDAYENLQKIEDYITGLREGFQQNSHLTNTLFTNMLNSGSASSKLPSYPAYESDRSEDSRSGLSE